MSSYRLLLFDLDGTLLNSRKEITPKTYEALEKAADAGIEIIPCTGRYYEAMPECVKRLPFVHYTININGAEIYDVRKKESIFQALIPADTAIRIMDYFDTIPAAYDVYMDNWGYMNQTYYDTIEKYVNDPFTIESVYQYRRPVPCVKDLVRENGRGIQKTQMFTLDRNLLAEATAYIREHFPECVPTSSCVNNAEVNSLEATKGNGLLKLAELLDIPVSETMAFGDGGNDVSMLRAAGMGIAMGNGHQVALDAADYITRSNDEDGIAYALEKFVLK